MKKIICFVFLLMLFPISGEALEIECPEVVSPGEGFYCSVICENVNGMKANFDIDSKFLYDGSSFQEPWKSYYDSAKGFSVSNGREKNNLEGKIYFKVGLDALGSYSLGFINIEISDLAYNYQNIANIYKNIKVVSDISTLNSLELSNGNFDKKFDKDVYTYTATIDSEYTVITAISSDNSAKVSGNIGQVKLNYGINVFTIVVTSARGTVKEYKLYITRPVKNEVIVNKALLTSLKINPGKLDFVSDKFYYRVSVDNKVTKVDIEAHSYEGNQVLVSNKEFLEVGENIIPIKVVANDGSECTYVLVVVRQKKLSSDSSIKSLAVKGYNIDFDSSKYDYNLTILNEDKLGIEVILNDEGSSYKIKGNKDLKTGSIIEIAVIAEDGSSSKYTIYINKELETNTSSILDYVKFYPLVIFICLMILILVVKVIRRKFVN